MTEPRLLGDAQAEAARIPVALADALRDQGVEVSTTSVLLAARGLSAVGLTDRRRVYAAARAALVHRPEDFDAYDRAFARVFGGRYEVEDPPVRPPDIPTVVAVDDPASAAPGEQAPAQDGEELTLRFSRTEVLRHADFAQLTDTELEEALRLMADLRIVTATRRSRRLQPTRRSHGHDDLRRTVRRALATGGEPLRRGYRGPSTRPRRLVLLVDVSGSMRPYARGLLRFAHAAVAGRTRVEAFSFATRLTRITRELDSRDPEEALDRAAAAVEDYASGTRLGEALRTFNDDWGVAGLARGAVVVILSDGWDRGDPEVLAEQVQRLHRVTHRLVWVNPLKAAPGYAPLAQGMAAALPHVDEFVEGHSVGSLLDLARVIGA